VIGIFNAGVYVLSIGCGAGWAYFARKGRHVEMLLCGVIWALLMILLK
jgi:putative component of toxin-antitoxin plasmid stabilization module